jgi:hypothetical protein
MSVLHLVEDSSQPVHVVLIPVNSAHQASASPLTQGSSRVSVPHASEFSRPTTLVQADLPDQLTDGSCCCAANTSVAQLTHCCAMIPNDVTVNAALFGPGHCLSSDLWDSTVITEQLHVALHQARDFVESWVAQNPIYSGFEDALVILRLYTMVQPPVFSLLNGPFCDMQNRDPFKLLNQLPFMKCMLLSHACIYSSFKYHRYRGPAFRGLKVSKNSVLLNKYHHWREEYKLGAKLTLPGFISVSVRLDKAEEYAERMIMVFYDVVGLRLKGISLIEEGEVLIKPPAVFIITEAEMKWDGTLYIYLKPDYTNTLTYL